MEVSSPHGSPVAEPGSVRKALKRLSFRGWTNSQHTPAEDSEVSNIVAANGQCGTGGPEVTYDIDSNDNLSASETCFTPITDIDSLTMLAVMDEANRSDYADVSKVCRISLV